MSLFQVQRCTAQLKMLCFNGTLAEASSEAGLTLALAG